MRDCSNVEMREQLPELMHGVLRADVAAEVRAHVAQCADCRAELALLESVRSVLSPVKPVDTARIVSKLPRYRRPSVWARMTRSPQLRAAAAVVLIVGGYVAVSRTRGDFARPDTTVATAPAPGTSELAIGDTFQDLSDADLTAMLEEIARLQPVTPVAIDEDG